MKQTTRTVPTKVTRKKPYTRAEFRLSCALEGKVLKLFTEATRNLMTIHEIVQTHESLLQRTKSFLHGSLLHAEDGSDCIDSYPEDTLLIGTLRRLRAMGGDLYSKISTPLPEKPEGLSITEEQWRDYCERRLLSRNQWMRDNQ